MNNYFDIGTTFKRVYGSTKHSLDYVCEMLFQRKLCKFNQCLDWGSRPLRKGQLHYAGLDAYVLHCLFGRLVAEMKKNGYGEDEIKNFVYDFEC